MPRRSTCRCRVVYRSTATPDGERVAGVNLQDNADPSGLKLPTDGGFGAVAWFVLSQYFSKNRCKPTAPTVTTVSQHSTTLLFGEFLEGVALQDDLVLPSLLA